MLRPSVRILFGLTALMMTVIGTGVLTLSPVAAQAEGDGLDPEALQAIVESIPGEYVTSVIYRVESGDDVQYLSAGVADVETEEPPSIEGHFRIGSITKTFTAVAVLQLVEQGLLELDDSVQSYLPGVLPESYPTITLRNLLQHTGGLADFELALGFGDPEIIVRDRYHTWQSADIVAEMVQQPLQFTPGEQMVYNNTGYLLLGMVIEAVTGESYAEAVREGILEPLGLENTFIPGAETAIPEPYAHGYIGLNDDGESTLVDISDWSPSYAGSAGDMISTLDDLNAFFDALMEGQLLSPPLLDEMLTPPEGLELSPGGSYGLGIAILSLPDAPRLYGHNGWVPGYHTVAWTTRDGSLSVVGSATVTFAAGQEQPAADILLPAVFLGPQQ
jgi:D-alanyl-D-alanine carboxypeptidase